MNYKNLLPLIGVILFLFILSGINVGEVGSLIAGARVEYVALGVSLLFLLIPLKALKWNTIVKSYDIDYSVYNATKAWLIGFFLGIVTPGRIGDFSRAYYMKKESGVSLGRSLTTVVADRIIDVAVLFFLAITGLVFIASGFRETGVLVYVSVLFVGFILVVFLFTKKGTTRYFLKPISRVFIPEKYHERLSSLFHDFYGGISQLSKTRLMASVIIGGAGWMLSIFQYHLFALALGIELGTEVPLLLLFAVVPVVILLDALPISFSGIGTRDAALVFFFSLASIGAERAISLSLLIFTFDYLMVGMTGMLLWIRNPIKFREGILKKTSG